MKKYKIRYILVMLLGILTGSCSDYLNTIPIDKASPETYLENESQARSLLTGIYNCLYDDSQNYMFPYCYENMCDNSYNPHTWECATEFGKGTQNSNSALTKVKWTKDWQAISRCNTLLRGLASANSLPTSVKEAITAETRFMRAYFYYDLVIFYGRVPLLDEKSSIEDPAREEIEKVMAFMYEDVNYAIQYLPHEFGGEKACKGAAYMLKLRMAQYQYEHEIVIECAKAIKSLGYSLYSDYKNLFLEKGIDDAANKEVIFKINYATDLKSSYMTMLWYHWFSFQTTIAMVNSFFTIHGLPIYDIQIEGGETIDRDPTYDPEHPFTNRDPRLRLSVLCPGDEYRLDAQARYQEHWRPVNWDVHTGFIPKKGANEALANTLNDGNDKIMMRYGEVLLAWAESENELNGPKNVYALIDELRNRVGMITLTSSLPNLTKSAMRELIRNERRVELFHEGQRWLDIRRWKIAEKVMTDAEGLDVSLLIWYSDGNITPDWSYATMVIDKRSFNKDRDYLWPIPQSEIDSNLKMKDDQNPNY